ncbi:MAG: isoprenylcysteine carboxylmethyltransferase family protein [Anaerolineales bacterium]|nr:isoprenylcysteine carboxylmethyltransferase family protein [Anaerolineales bacterium]
MTLIYKITLYVLGTIGIVWVSRSSLRNVQTHGFYRFFAWESILILFLMNMSYWFADPFSLRQITSWVFLITSLVLIYLAVRLFRGAGKPDQERKDPALVGIEKTTQLVTTGVYYYIRHPFYSSLLFLAWGILLKNISWIGILLAVITTILLIITAKIEEIENILYFGDKYQEYMERTKMFVPFVL